MKFDPAAAFIDDRKIQISFALERQQLLLFAFLQIVMQERYFDLWSYFSDQLDIDFIFLRIKLDGWIVELWRHVTLINERLLDAG